MKIKIEVTKEELEEMGFNSMDLIDHIIKTLNSSNKNLVEYNVHVNDWICS